MRIIFYGKKLPLEKHDPAYSEIGICFTNTALTGSDKALFLSGSLLVRVSADPRK
jgi:hypothetical protein